MAGTGVYLNWTAVEFATSPISKVTSVMFDQGGQLIEFAGDNDRYPVVIANNMNSPKASITSGDVYTLMNIVPGTAGTLTATQKDGLGVSMESIVWTITGNAVHENTQDTGAFSQWASATATFRAFSTDGATNPLTSALG